MISRHLQTGIIVIASIGFALALASCTQVDRQVSTAERSQDSQPSIGPTVEVSGRSTESQSVPTQIAQAPTEEAEGVEPQSESGECTGWAVHLVSVETIREGGWLHFIGELALENIDASFESQNVPDRIAALFSRPAVLTMTTNEGYSYTQEDSDFGLTHWVPPGFRYKSTLWRSASLEFRVAESTTGHQVSTACGVLDFDDPSADLEFPTGLPDTEFLSLGTPIDLAQGQLTLTGFQDYTIEDARNDPEFRGGMVDVTRVFYTFSNPDQGYGIENQYILAFVIDSEGYLSMPEASGFYLTAGPGQTADGLFLISLGENRKLVLLQDRNYWIFALD